MQFYTYKAYEISSPHDIAESAKVGVKHQSIIKMMIIPLT